MALLRRDAVKPGRNLSVFLGQSDRQTSSTESTTLESLWSVFDLRNKTDPV